MLEEIFSHIDKLAETKIDQISFFYSIFQKVSFFLSLFPFSFSEQIVILALFNDILP